MRRGRPPRHGRRRNIKWLRNSASESCNNNSDDLASKRPRRSHSRSRAPSPASISDHTSEDNWKPPTVFDSLKFVANDDESDIESDAEDIAHSDGPVDDSSCCSRLIDFAASINDNPCDETWLPPREAKRLAQRKARPIRYKKGPDVGSKSVRTQRRYIELLRNQKSLTSLGFTVLPKLTQPALITPAAKISESSPSTPCQDLEPDLEPEGNTSDDAGTMTPVSTAPPVADSQLSAGLDRGVEAWEEELEEQER
ncbi:hypothetical protein K503DRAFT_776408, partial [Rhizopogon vinicolor AM-OR11-026]